MRIIVKFLVGLTFVLVFYSAQAYSTNLLNKVEQDFKGATKDELSNIHRAYRALSNATGAGQKISALQELQKVLKDVATRNLRLPEDEQNQVNRDLAIRSHKISLFIRRNFSKAVDKDSCTKKSSGLNHYQEIARFGYYDLDSEDNEIRTWAEQTLAHLDFVIVQACQ